MIGSDADFTVTFDRRRGRRTALASCLRRGRTIFTIKPNGTGIVNTGVDGQSDPTGNPSPSTPPRHLRPPAGRDHRSASRSSRPPSPARPPTASTARRSHSAPAARRSRASLPDRRRRRRQPGARALGRVRAHEGPAGAPGPPDDSDVTIRLSLTNVMRAADLSEYTGELRGELTVRRTDREPGLGRLDLDGLPIRLHGAVRAHAGLEPRRLHLQSPRPASTRSCPGAIKDADRTIWALDKLRVYDGGPDEDADTERRQLAVHDAGRVRAVGAPILGGDARSRPTPSVRSLHLIGAAVWAGGMVMLALAVGAARRTVAEHERIALFRALGRRFAIAGGIAMVVLIATGTDMAADRLGCVRRPVRHRLRRAAAGEAGPRGGRDRAHPVPHPRAGPGALAAARRRPSPTRTTRTCAARSAARRPRPGSSRPSTWSPPWRCWCWRLAS